MFRLSQADSPDSQCSQWLMNLLAFRCNKQGDLVYKHMFGEAIEAPND
jgi:hypothetical protein